MRAITAALLACALTLSLVVCSLLMRRPRADEEPEEAEN